MAILVNCIPDLQDRYPYSMTSDKGLEELVDFACRLGLRSDWMKRDDGMPHFRITGLKRKEAIERGAMAASMREIVTAASRIAKGSASNLP